MTHKTPENAILNVIAVSYRGHKETADEEV